MLTADRALLRRVGWENEFAYQVQAGSKVFRGSIVALCLDLTVVPAGSANTGAAQEAVVGIAAEFHDATGAGLPNEYAQAGRYVPCQRGVFLLPFDAPPTAAAIGQAVYALDDQVVSLAQGTPAHLRVGVLFGFDERGQPWVQI